MSRRTDEESPLLPERQPETTPIPRAQFLILIILQLAEPVTFSLVTPFAPQLIRDIGITHGNEAKVGFYVGLLQSLFYVAEAITILHWSRTSDHIGRKPVILLGLFGLSISMYCFGLSRTFLGLVLSRVLNGALNGNTGVMKCMMAELSDSTNIAQIYSAIPFAWAAGGTIGPIIGGSLSHPAEQFPSTFGKSEFLKKYPYFLPCAVAATFTATVWLFVLFFLKESHKHPIPITEYLKLKKSKSHPRHSNTRKDSQQSQIPESDKPVPIRRLLTRRTFVAGGGYAASALLDIMFRAVQPVFYATPIALGGLGLPSSVIGNILSAYGILNGIFQVFFFAKIHNAWGSKKTYIVGILCAIPMFICFPVMSLLVEHQGRSAVIWGLVALQVVSFVGLSFSYGASFVFVAASAPNKASLGATNGLSQMSVSIMRAIGPAAVNSLFSLSLEKQIMGGFFVYYALIAVTLWALWVGSLLPTKPWGQ